jgi:ketosteroid isomerase-like protein
LLTKEDAMTTTHQRQVSTPTHPFPAAIAARDHAALVETLAADVVLHSAVTATPFEGRETVADIYASVIDSFDHVEVVDGAVARVLRLTALPLGPLFSLLDPLTRWLARPNRT